MRNPTRLFGCAWLLLAAACASVDTVTYPTGATAPLFTDLGSHHHEVNTDSALAQRYFDQGLTWAYAFNHDEAIRSFEQALVFDADCAMAWWGVALCHGPHINNATMSPDDSREAWTAVQRAVALKGNAEPLERRLIEALAERYAWPAPEHRALDRAYADAMGALWREYPHDTDVGTLYAEALMDLRPWDLWTHEGLPQPGTMTILDVLDKVLTLDTANPGANHLQIHALEASPEFRKALASAERLRDLVPAAGHLVHMPTHIDVLIGEWDMAVAQSKRAIMAEERYLPYSPNQGFYVRYIAHNHQMLAFACMMSGRSERGLRAARDLVAGVPEELARSKPQVIDSKMPMIYEVLMRFGRWDAILAEPAPPQYLPLSTAIWRFARGVALAAKGELESAERERAEMLSVVASLPKDAKFENAPASEVFAVADHTLRGEMAFHRGDIDAAVDALSQAVHMEDRLTYDEPPVWVQPVRHALGAVLVSAGRHEQAEAFYREDLENWPNNGWSLHGLETCLRARGAQDQADQAHAQFERAWANADTVVGASCLCVLIR